MKKVKWNQIRKIWPLRCITRSNWRQSKIFKKVLQKKLKEIRFFFFWIIGDEFQTDYFCSLLSRFTYLYLKFKIYSFSLDLKSYVTNWSRKSTERKQYDQNSFKQIERGKTYVSNHPWTICTYKEAFKWWQTASSFLGCIFLLIKGEMLISSPFPTVRCLPHSP